MKIENTILLVVILAASFGNVAAQKIKAVPDKDSANVLKLAKTSVELPTTIETDGAGASTLAVSPDKRFSAYVLCVPPGSKETDHCAARVFIRDESSKTVYVVTGEDLFAEAGRPVDSIKWTNAYTLSYERWMSPHFGHRYIIDVRSMKQTRAFALSG